MPTLYLYYLLILLKNNLDDNSMKQKSLYSHPIVKQSTEQLNKGQISRRQFVRNATLVGLSFSSASYLLGQLTGSPFTGQANAQSKPSKGGHLRCSMRIQEIKDPAKFDWEKKSNITRHIIEYLTFIDDQNILHPYLASSWEVSDDLKKWTFNLQKNVKWSNGDHFIADDVIFNIKRWLDPKTGSSNLSLFKNIKSADSLKKINDHQFVIELEKPDISIPENFYEYPTAIVHRDFEKMGADFRKNPIGTGAFELKSFQVGKVATLEKRDPKLYWGNEVYLDKITYIDHGDDPSAPITALASGQVDLIHECHVDQVPIIKQLPNVKLYTNKTARSSVFRMQVDKKPFDDKRVRQAISLCQNKDRLNQLSYQNSAILAEDHHVCPVHPAYVDISAPKQNYEKAKQLLKEAGYEKGLDITLDLKKETTWEVSLAQAFAQMCKPAGINIKLNIMPATQYWEIWDKTPFGLTNWGHRSLEITVLNLGYRSGAPWNETHFNNKEFDNLLDLANSSLDIEERKKHIEKIERLLQEEAIIVQPYWCTIFSASLNNVKNFKLHPGYFHNFNETSIDEA